MVSNDSYNSFRFIQSATTSRMVECKLSTSPLLFAECFATSPTQTKKRPGRDPGLYLKPASVEPEQGRADLCVRGNASIRCSCQGSSPTRQGAIVARKQIVCVYNGYIRECCPHAIGTTNGIERVLVYQFGGGSSRGLPPGGEWRCMDIPNMAQVIVQSGTWYSGARHTRPQTCVKQVDLDITMT